MNAGDVQKMLDWMAEKRVQSEDLDELVHDIKSKEASQINNGGLERQVQFLLECMEIEELKSGLYELYPHAMQMEERE
jgi:hypothetical protein